MNKKIKKFFNILFLIIAIIMIGSSFASAQTTIGASDIPAIIMRVADFLKTIVFSLAVVFGLIAAFYYITAKPENIKKAHQHLLFAAVAIVVSIFAYGIEAFISSFISPATPSP